MSPEQAEGKKVDARSDVFSFGSVLYEMLTGRRAFQAESKLATMAAVVGSDPDPVDAEVPANLRTLVARCLRKDPARRFQHMDDVRVALEDLKEEFESDTLTGQKPRAGAAKGFRLWRVLAFTGAAAALVSGSWLWFPRALFTKPELARDALPLTSYPGHETDPSFSPDGTQVAFAWNRDNSDHGWDIYVKQIGVEEPFRLTHDPAADRFPAWSPDGGYIAFIRERPAGGLGLMLVPQRGGPERLLAEFLDLPVPVFSITDSMLTWTPEGNTLVVAAREDSQQPSVLFAVSVATGQRRRLTSVPSGISGDVSPAVGLAGTAPPNSASSMGGDSNPAVSPTGTSVAFTRVTASARNDLYVLRLAPGAIPVGEPVKLPAPSPMNSGVAWTADAREVVFHSASNYFAGGGLYGMAPFPSATPSRLVVPGQNPGCPAFALRGNRFVYRVTNSDQNIWKVDLTASTIPKSRKPIKLIASTRADFEPD